MEPRKNSFLESSDSDALWQGWQEIADFSQNLGELWLRGAPVSVDQPRPGQAVFYPKSASQLARLLAKAREERKTLSLASLSSTYTFEHQIPDLFVDLSRMSRVLTEDAEAGIFEVEVGLSLEILAQRLRSLAWQPPWEEGPWGAETVASALLQGRLARKPRDQVFLESVELALPSGQLKTLSLGAQGFRQVGRTWGAVGLRFRARPAASAWPRAYHFSDFLEALRVFKDLAAEPGLDLILKDPLATLVESLWLEEESNLPLLKNLKELLAPYWMGLAKPLLTSSPWVKNLLSHWPYPASLSLLYLEHHSSLQTKVKASLGPSQARSLGAKQAGASLNFLASPFTALGLAGLQASLVLPWLQIEETYLALMDLLQKQGQGLAWAHLGSYSSEACLLDLYYWGDSVARPLPALAQSLADLTQKNLLTLLSCSHLSPSFLLERHWQEEGVAWKKFKAKMDPQRVLVEF